MWFAFVLWITFDWYQPIEGKSKTTNSCDLLSFFELHLIDTNICQLGKCSEVVVICFRSLNYIWLIPTANLKKDIEAQLWFAFVLWITFDWYQPNTCVYLLPPCCDLLSFFELHLIDTNKTKNQYWKPKLWFAFVLWITFDWYQQNCGKRNRR